MSERRRDAEFVAQPGLFDSPVFHPAINGRDVVTANQITRTSHPDTSRSAAERLIATSKRTRDADDAMDLVRQFPGLTGYELDAKAGERMSRRISRRLGDLKNQGRVRNGDDRICEQCKAMCVTWYPNLSGANMQNDAMPDQVTAPKTPRDQAGDPMKQGRKYLIDNQRVLCFEDEQGAMFVQHCTRLGQPVPGSRPQSIDLLPVNCRPFRILGTQ